MVFLPRHRQRPSPRRLMRFMSTSSVFQGLTFFTSGSTHFFSKNGFSGP